MVKRINQVVGSGVSKRIREQIAVSGPEDEEFEQSVRESLRTSAKLNEPWAWLNRDRLLAERTLAAIDTGEIGNADGRIFESHHGIGWYSEKILNLIGWIESARDKGDLERACRYSAKLAEVTTTLWLKRAWDKDDRPQSLAGGGSHDWKHRICQADWFHQCG